MRHEVHAPWTIKGKKIPPRRRRAEAGRFKMVAVPGVLPAPREQSEVLPTSHAATLSAILPAKCGGRHRWRNLCRKKVGRGPPARSAPFLWASASHSAVPGRPPPQPGGKTEASEARISEVKGAHRRTRTGGGAFAGSAMAREERADLRGGRDATPARGHHPRARGPPRNGCGGARSQAGRLAPLQGAHCAEMAGWPLPSRARQVGSVRLAAGVGNHGSGFRRPQRPVLKDIHADATGRSGTFQHAAQTVRRDGSRAPAGPRPAAKGAERGMREPLRLDIRNQNIRVSTCQFFSGFT